MSLASTCLCRLEATEKTVVLLRALLDSFANCLRDLGMSLVEKGSHRLEPHVFLAPLDIHSCTLAAAVVAAGVAVGAVAVVVVEELDTLEEPVEVGQSNRRQTKGLNLLVPSPVPNQQQIAIVKGHCGEIDVLEILTVVKQDSP